VNGAIDMLATLDPFRADASERVAGLRRYLLLDVFTDAPLRGNQLAVFTDGRGLEPERMQLIARELNLSETVFMLPPQDGGDVRVRIFTPGSELPFAGHPVLGSAIVAGLGLGREEITLETQAGHVPVALAPAQGGARFGRMHQPIPTWREFERPRELLAALGVERSQLPVEIYDNGPHHVYVALASEDEVARLAPDMRGLLALGEIEANCFAGSGSRWKTRMFAPAVGVPEDPATGSAAGPLALHLARHGLIAFGEEIEIRQGEEIGRPSLLRARAEGSSERVERIEVGGSAVIVAAGDFLL
jgi:trans-2,3-dihydro-3-hydroxyanthranilate isomerase